MIRIAINALNMKSQSDISKLDSLIEWFGIVAADRRFILIARESHEDLFKAPPDNFNFQFYKYPSFNGDKDNGWIENELNGSYGNKDCDLLFEFAGSVSLNLNCPKVSLISPGDLIGFTGDIGPRRSPKPKLKFIKKAESENPDITNGVIFPSRLTHRNIYRKFENTNMKSTAIFLGCSETGEIEGQDVLSRYGIKEKYLTAFVSSAHAKELALVLKSFSRAFDGSEDIPDLVLVGNSERPGDVSKVLKTISRAPNSDSIKYAGNISGGMLSALLEKTGLFIMPVESEESAEMLVSAMKSGCAIISSNKGAPLEITEGAALYFDNNNFPDFVFKLRLLFEDYDLNLFLRNKALERAKFYSWRNTATRIVSFFDDILQNQ